jgi:hypothetical protein
LKVVVMMLADASLTASSEHAAMARPMLSFVCTVILLFVLLEAASSVALAKEAVLIIRSWN